MLSTLLSLIAHNIEITVGPDRFQFKRKNEIKTFSTRVYLANNEGKMRLLGIGEQYIPSGPSVCIELFSKNSPLDIPLSKEECLDTFMREAIRSIHSRSSFLRPKIIFKDAASLNDIMCGYQYSVLKSAALNAGAHKVVFQNNGFV